MGSCSYSTECKKVVHYALVHNTTITVVHNIHSGAQHIHDTKTFRLPERQVASTRGGGEGGARGAAAPVKIIMGGPS